MKTENEIRILLKSYETRRFNIYNKWIASRGLTLSGYNNNLETLKQYDARIQTCKVILK